MNVVITGITGFAGSHLAEYLARKGHRIRGLSAPRDPLTNLDRLISDGDLCPDDVILEDLENLSALELLLDPRPDFVYHLAAQASVPRAWQNPRETFRINVMGTLALMERLKEMSPCPKILYVGSADEYGSSARTIEMDENGEYQGLAENTPLQPSNPYSLSKAAADSMCQQIFQRDGMPIIRVRAFNHLGPRQSGGFAAADFARQIVRGEMERKNRILHVGNLDAVRDFLDVRDVVRAYELAITKGEPGAVYNICSGKGRTLQRLLDDLLSLSYANFKVVRDPDLMRPADVPFMVGSNKRFNEATGWSSEIPWTQTLEDILEDYRRRAMSEVNLMSSYQTEK
jgi:GDP-4-dehydro-6-deoxy-D-mannose reductase